MAAMLWRTRTRVSKRVTKNSYNRAFPILRSVCGRRCVLFMNRFGLIVFHCFDLCMLGPTFCRM